MSLAPSREALAIADPRVVLVPVEAVGPGGILPDGRRLLVERAGLAEADVDLLDAGHRLYLQRASDLARRTIEISPPTRRGIAIVLDGRRVRPFAALLNDSAWILDRGDVDARRSSPELIAWLFAVADRLRQTPDVTLAPVQVAAWWFERSERERADFAAAAMRSDRPDADALRALAEAIPHLRELRHDRLRPPRRPAGHRPIPGTGLLVPAALEEAPPRIVEGIRAGARAAEQAFRARCAENGDAAKELRRLRDWLADEEPPLVVVRRGAIAWSPDRPRETVRLAEALAGAPACAVGDLHLDLAVVAGHSRRFLGALVDADRLAPTDQRAEQGGYCFMHREAGVVALDLDEPGLERLSSNAIPWAREMLGARCLHEWSHRAVDSGWVPSSVDDAAFARLGSELARLLDGAIAAAPRPLRELAREQESRGSPGEALARRFASRLPDWNSNLLASCFWSPVEREVYVSHNVRPLDGFFPPQGTWRKLVRHLYEAQYLEFSGLPDRDERYVEISGIAPQLSRLGIDRSGWADLLSAARALCLAHGIDVRHVRLPAGAHGSD